MAYTSRKVKIHQALHGYRNGHQLLASSVELPQVTRRLMLSISDLSGSSTSIKFDSYLTGYPLAELGSYAFARTWYADEMRRPGCVWTQTLLIAFDQLDTIFDIAALDDLFVRPPRPHTSSSTDNNEFELYEKPLEVDVKTTYNTANRLNASVLPTGLIESLLNSIYRFPEESVVCSAPDFDIYEDCILAIFSQQWPRLQRNFTFCTGSISSRSLNNRTFDLQVAPSTAVQKFRREMPNGRFVEVPFIGTFVASFWCDAAKNDLKVPNVSGLRDFLRKYGIDASPNRSTFVSLTDTFLDVKNYDAGRLSLESLIESVGERFPTTREASVLKTSLFGIDHLISFSDSDLLIALAGCMGFKAFDEGALQLRRRATAISQTDLTRTTELIIGLIQSPLNALGQRILEAFFESFNIDDLLSIAKIRPSLLPLLVSRYPLLASNPIIWQESLDQNQRLVDSLIRESETNWSTIIPAMLEAKVHGVAHDLADAIGYVFVESVLEWINQDSQPGKSVVDLVSYEWKQLLISHPEHLIQWIKSTDKINFETIAFVISLLNPHSNIVTSLADSVWTDFAGQAVNSSNSQARLDVMAFLLAFSLNNVSGVAPLLASVAFCYVHEGVSQDRITQQSWRWFQGSVPTFEYWKDWDKCEKLRQGLVNAFIKYNWPISCFISALSNEDTFARTIDYCGSFREGKLLVSRIQDGIDKGTLNAPGFVRQVLKDKKRRKWFGF